MGAETDTFGPENVHLDTRHQARAPRHPSQAKEKPGGKPGFGEKREEGIQLFGLFAAVTSYNRMNRKATYDLPEKRM